jgi:hypothetical protein
MSMNFHIKNIFVGLKYTSLLIKDFKILFEINKSILYMQPYITIWSLNTCIKPLCLKYNCKTDGPRYLWGLRSGKIPQISKPRITREHSYGQKGGLFITIHRKIHGELRETHGY